MAVSTHLGIPLREYDARIRTFIPHYEEMLRTAAQSLPFARTARATIVDLGIGSGALAAQCLIAHPRARVVGIDMDADILQMASARLGTRLTAIAGSFESAPLPSCDAIVSAFALHHVRTLRQKAAVYRRCHRALTRGGALVIADCQPASDARLAAQNHRAWLAHLEQHYSTAEARAYLRAWAKEDWYVSLNDEQRLLQSAGFSVDIRWRRDSFAVIVAAKTSATR